MDHFRLDEAACQISAVVESIAAAMTENRLAWKPPSGHVTLDPLDFGAELGQHSARDLRDRLELIARQIACAGDVSFNHVLWHRCLLFSGFVFGESNAPIISWEWEQVNGLDLYSACIGA